MALTIAYKKLKLIPISVIWFNLEQDLKSTKFKGLYIFRQSVKLADIKNFNCIQQYSSTTSIIDLNQSEDDLWKSLDAKSCRYEIRKIKKLIESGEKIEIKNNIDIEGFIDIANRYIKERGYTKALTRWQIEMYLNENKGELLNMYYNGHLIGGNFYLKDFPSRTRLLYSFNDRLSDSSVAKLSGALMRYLHWHAMVEKYKKEGFNLYDMGGVGTKTEATRRIAEFKLSFGGYKLEEQNYVFVSNYLIGKLYNFYRNILSKRKK